MAALNGTPAWLVGKTFDCAFGEFVPRLTVLSPNRLRVQALIGAAKIDEVVEADVRAVRPGLFVMNWTEENGNFVVQVQDHDSMVVQNYARLADGQLFCAQGTIDHVSEPDARN